VPERLRDINFQVVPAYLNILGGHKQIILIGFSTFILLLSGTHTNSGKADVCMRRISKGGKKATPMPRVAVDVLNTWL
jgi:hypothetical protein